MTCPAQWRVGPSPLCSEFSNIGSALTGNDSLLDFHKLIFHLCVNSDKIPLPLARFISPHWISALRCPCAVKNLLSSKWHPRRHKTPLLSIDLNWFSWMPSYLSYSTFSGPTLNKAPANQSWKSRTRWMHSEHWDDLFLDAWLICKHHLLNKKKQLVGNSWNQSVSSLGYCPRWSGSVLKPAFSFILAPYPTSWEASGWVTEDRSS